MAEGQLRMAGFAWTVVGGTAVVAGRRQPVKILHAEEPGAGVTIELLFGEKDWQAFQRRVAEANMTPQVQVFGEGDIPRRPAPESARAG